MSQLKYTGRFDPTKDRRILIWDAYPEFKKRAALSSVPPELTDFKGEKISLTDTEWSNFIRIAIAFAIKDGNPLEDESDIDYRLRRCIDLVWPSVSKEKRELMTQFSFLFRVAIFEVLKYNHSDIFSMWLTLRIKFYSDLMFLATPAWEGEDQSGARTDKITAGLEISRKRIESLELQIFPDTATRVLVEEVSNSSYLYAEKYAENYEIPFVPNTGA